MKPLRVGGYQGATERRPPFRPCLREGEKTQNLYRCCDTRFAITRSEVPGRRIPAVSFRLSRNGVSGTSMPADSRTKCRVIGRNLIFAGYSRVTIALLVGEKQCCRLKCFLVPFEGKVVESYLYRAVSHTEGIYY